MFIYFLLQAANRYASFLLIGWLQLTGINHNRCLLNLSGLIVLDHYGTVQ